MYLKQYLSDLTQIDLKQSIEETSAAVWTSINANFNYANHVRGLLLGNVQSGKTAQTIGVISRLADEGFQIFVVLTTDNVYLQAQTFARTQAALKSFDVLGEHDDVKLFSSGLSKPIAIILKKNSRVLKRWRNLLASSGYCLGRPITILDDEADAASLNTLVNKDRISTINNHLNSTQALASSSVYLQVTATPQAVLLQSAASGWKPDFANYFPPGPSYLGGDFFYSEPTSFAIRFTAENELKSVKEDDDYIPEGLRTSLISFLVVCAHFAEIGELTCNFLIHPSVRIKDHEIFAERIGEHLNLLLSSIADNEFMSELRIAWDDLQKSKPDITNFDDVHKRAVLLLENQEISIFVMNSRSPMRVEYDTGFNIIVGGNSLGRGLTLPKLQTIYYCRTSRTPQADTFWQHSRMFGYDRDPGLMRVYIPPLLHKLFTDLNNSNTALINQIEEYGFDGIQVIYPSNIRPTRPNVVDNRFVSLVTGGVNYFPREPIESGTEDLDTLLSSVLDEFTHVDIEYEFLLELLARLGSPDKSDWDKSKFVNCIRALNLKRPTTDYKLIVRRNRDISKGTGTMLSPIDRQLGDKFDESLVLTMYRLTGSKEKGWSGFPFWLPNIKFPGDLTYYDMDE